MLKNLVRSGFVCCAIALAVTLACAAEPEKAEEKPDAAGLISLAPDGSVKVDMKKKQVIVEGKVCLRKFPLEMFACTAGTKEHESVVVIPAKAHVVHAGLLRVGIQPGAPVQFRPDYKSVTGPEIEITLSWKDEKGKAQTARAQDWVRDIKTGKAMTAPFLFGGSGFVKDENTGGEYYRADDGDLVCVSNFTSAMIDVPVESSASADALMFEAFTENIPAIGTKVTMTFSEKKAEKQPAEKKSPKDR